MSLWYKHSLSLGFLKKALGNEGPSHTTRENYLLPTATAILFRRVEGKKRWQAKGQAQIRELRALCR
jgi:hypothetical protein